MRKQFITAKELAQVLDISVANAYLRIKEMNEELQKQNYQIIPGKVPLAFVKTKYYGINFEEEAAN